VIRREIGLFLFVGGLTVLIDFFVYSFLVWTQVFGVDVAKGIGFIIGTIFAYLANRFWTFGHKHSPKGNLSRFIILYLSTLSINVSVNRWILEDFSSMTYVVIFAFFVATSISATINFLGMKFFIFNGIKSK